MSSGLVQIRRTAPTGDVVAPLPAHEGSGQPATAGAALPAGADERVAAESASPAGPLAYVETYGCQMNVADTEMVLGMLGQAGYARTEDPARADLILINTCAVREKAEERVFGRASNLAVHKVHAKAQGRQVVLGITGCMAEHLKEKVQERAPYVDLVIGPDAYRRLLDHVDQVKGGQPALDTTLDRHETYEGLDPSREMTGGVTGHVTIQRGCDKFCTFCVVPYTRGRERGTPPREILRQARAMAAAGYKEIQLLGQTVNSYRYEEAGFADVLRAVAEVEGIERVRFTSPYPLDFSPEVIAAMAQSPKICKHVHLPLQSGSDAVLERMRRGYDYPTYLALVHALRTAMPSIAITTDLMVGFCGETEDEFQATLRAMQQIRFDSAFMFAYSEREGTVSHRRMPDDVPEPIKQRRLSEVIAQQRATTAEIMNAQLGARERVLVEAPSRRSDAEWLARTDAFRPVIVPAGPGVVAGALIDVTIDRTTSATLFGRPTQGASA